MNDPYHEAAIQAQFFRNLGGDGDQWSRVISQYCSGVPLGASQCTGAGTPAGNVPMDVLAGTWLAQHATPAATAAHWITRPLSARS